MVEPHCLNFRIITVIFEVFRNFMVENKVRLERVQEDATEMSELLAFDIMLDALHE